jgi:hypothetical protein
MMGHDASPPNGCDAVFLAPFVYEIEYKKKAKNKASQQQGIMPEKNPNGLSVVMHHHTVVVMHTHTKE